MTRNLILSGGVAHDYASTSPMLADILSQVGIVSEIHEDFALVEDGSLLGFDLLTLHCVRWTCEQTPPWRSQWQFHLSEAARRGLLGFLALGKGLLALHAATICFDDWPEYRHVLGAWWEWGSSGHAPLQEHRMHIVDGAHPLTAGIEDFCIYDELYTFPRTVEPLDPLVVGEWEGVAHPIVWLREYGSARICYNALGHGRAAYENASHRMLLQRGAQWATRGPAWQREGAG